MTIETDITCRSAHAVTKVRLLPRLRTTDRIRRDVIIETVMTGEEKSNGLDWGGRRPVLGLLTHGNCLTEFGASSIQDEHRL